MGMDPEVHEQLRHPFQAGLVDSFGPTIQGTRSAASASSAVKLLAFPADLPM